LQGVFEFWIDSNKPRSKDLQKGMQLRLLTQGESVFVDAFQFLNAKTNLFKGTSEPNASMCNPAHATDTPT
jgi:hypothetical protein